MKTRDDLRQIFEQFDQLRQSLAEQEQRRRRAQEELQQHKSEVRVAEAKLTAKKRGDWTREQLLAYAKQVREQIAHAKNDLGGSAPEQKLNDLRNTLVQSQTRAAQLQDAASHIARLAPLAERARAVRASVRLNDEIARIEEEVGSG